MNAADLSVYTKLSGTTVPSLLAQLSQTGGLIALHRILTTAISYCIACKLIYLQN